MISRVDTMYSSRDQSFVDAIGGELKRSTKMKHGHMNMPVSLQEIRVRKEPYVGEGNGKESGYAQLV